MNLPVTDYDPETEVESCQTCGDSFVTEEVCQHCQKQGPFCESCLSHHLKHCSHADDISFYEDCSECENNMEEEEETLSDHDFIVHEEEEEQDYIEHNEDEDDYYEEKPDSP